MFVLEELKFGEWKELITKDTKQEVEDLCKDIKNNESLFQDATKLRRKTITKFGCVAIKYY